MEQVFCLAQTSVLITNSKTSNDNSSKGVIMKFSWNESKHANVMFILSRNLLLICVIDTLLVGMEKKNSLWRSLNLYRWLFLDPIHAKNKLNHRKRSSTQSESVNQKPSFHQRKQYSLKYTLKILYSLANPPLNYFSVYQSRGLSVGYYFGDLIYYLIQQLCTNRLCLSYIQLLLWFAAN